MQGTKIVGEDRQGGRDAWNRYWKTGAAEAPDQALRNRSIIGQLERHWDGILAHHSASGMPGPMLELACGTGSVIRLARRRLAAGTDSGPDVFGVDFSDAAARHTGCGLVGDVARLPFASGRFALVVSQFGLEYAGRSAFCEAARVLAGSGSFHAVIHRRNSGIWQENRSSLDLLDTVADTQLLQKCERVLETGYQLDRGAAAQAGFDTHYMTFRAAADVADQARRRAPPSPAKAYLDMLVPDLSDFVQRRQRFDPRQLRDWLAAQARTLDVYAFRMRSMLDAAMAEDDIKLAVGDLAAGRHAVCEIGSLSLSGQDRQDAWTVLVRPA
ncbi:class I SAM-dependent methyltransferase [Maricaulis sp.]|uniref:class I SAM-dependent methyltransferase n=1 Tax=Maricaulis sp. TaxID=1486257 RepID=UPI002626F1FB|nr:class I SAM-dependent methyltransferase [Maricaulis sp.]